MALPFATSKSDGVTSTGAVLMAVDAKNHGGWIGRSIRRLEDPTLVAGHGRFTGDLPAARWVRFVRSSVASGRI